MKHVTPRDAERAAEREAMRATMEAQIEAWIAALDALDAEDDGCEPDDEADLADDEPSLGWTALMNQERAMRFGPDVGSHEGEFGGDVADPEAEPMLGAPERHPLRSRLLVFDGCVDRSPAASQLGWAAGGDVGEREENCEDREDSEDSDDADREEDWRRAPRTKEDVKRLGQGATRTSEAMIRARAQPYAMLCVGDCMEPLIHSGTKLVMDPAVVPVDGDLVCIWRHQDEGSVTGQIKRLAAGVPPVDFAGGEVETILMFEMLSPYTHFSLRQGQWAAVHKIIGVKKLDGTFDPSILSRNAAHLRIAR